MERITAWKYLQASVPSTAQFFVKGEKTVDQFERRDLYQASVAYKREQPAGLDRNSSGDDEER
jgi:hypothetical protein